MQTYTAEWLKENTPEITCDSMLQVDAVAIILQKLGLQHTETVVHAYDRIISIFPSGLFFINNELLAKATILPGINIIEDYATNSHHSHHSHHSQQ
jgi:hypothetical protein